jgi:protein-L-isoaspartate O-methyltransferase
VRAEVRWEEHAAGLARQAAGTRSHWFPAVAAVPRHALVPAWFGRDHEAGPWRSHDGPSGSQGDWLDRTYADETLVTRVGPLHADHAGPDEHPAGHPTSCAAQPGLALRLLRLAGLRPGDAVCELGTGPGYTAALLCQRFGDSRITSIDVDSYLSKSAAERLAAIGYCPALHTGDATGPLPGEFDAIIASFSVRHCPPSWLSALRPGGRLVFAITGTRLAVVADKRPDGGASGRVEPGPVALLAARHGPDYDPVPGWPSAPAVITRRIGRHPVIDLAGSADLVSAFALAAPGVQARFGTTRQGVRELRLWDQAGSWALARGLRSQQAIVQQAGRRRLWDELETVMDMWLPAWSFPWDQARVEIRPGGAIALSTPAGRQLTIAGGGAEGPASPG